MSPVRRGFVILFSAAAVVALALLLAQDQETLRPRSAVSAADSRFPEYVAALIGADVTRGNRYEVLTNGDQFFPAMFAAVNQAKKRISFETYIYDTGIRRRPVHRGARSGGAARRARPADGRFCGRQQDGKGPCRSAQGRRLLRRVSSTRRTGIRSRS